MNAAALQLREIAGRAGPVDTLLLWVAGGLILFGLVMVTSASISIAERDAGAPFYYLGRQLVALVIGLMMASVAALLAPHVWRRFAPFGLLAVIALLSLVLLPGIGLEANGAQRWIDLGPMTLHPAEMMKIAFVVFLASFIARCGDGIRRYGRYTLVPVGVLAFVALLLLPEPDFGTIFVLGALLMAMLFIAGVPFGTFALWCVSLVSALGLLAFAAPYRVQRMLNFMDPWQDPWNHGFQLVQALIAIGSGGWFGTGLGGSVQKLSYLPAVYTDFIFSVVGEELGFVGMVVVLLLFVVLIWRAFRIGARARDLGQRFSAHLAWGLGLLLGLQAFIHIGVNLGAGPTKGLALPFISYAGNNLMMSCVAVGFLLRIARDTGREVGHEDGVRVREGVGA